MSHGYKQQAAGRHQETAPATVPHLWRGDQGPRGMVTGAGGSPALLAQAPRGHAVEGLEAMRSAVELEAPDLGDLVVVLLASTLAGLRDQLSSDGFDPAAELVAELVEVVDDYLTGVPR